MVKLSFKNKMVRYGIGTNERYGIWTILLRVLFWAEVEIGGGPSMPGGPHCDIILHSNAIIL